jgi:hypothetical protein
MKSIHKIIISFIVGLFLFTFLLSNNLIKAPATKFLEKSENNPPEYLPIKEADNEQSSIIDGEKNGWKTYINHQAKFKIDFPEHLYVIEDYSERELKLKNVSKALPNYDEVIQYDKILQGEVMFCAEKVTLSQNYCHQGLEILYGIPMSDGWGGGCDEQYRKEIQFNGKTKMVCDTPNRIYLLFADHPHYEAEINISLNFADGFERQTGLIMLDSFEFIENDYN